MTIRDFLAEISWWETGILDRDVLVLDLRTKADHEVTGISATRTGTITLEIETEADEQGE